ncbi:Na+/H+ antiporter NhaC family protein [Bacillus sp. FJAT-27231]|uniref:Na+/H+ antiporter NhaC family protein n=1 Tax=Bacillus sp. FJAT-27231 TaxID=1679168 RepID=UPI0009E65646
MTILSSTGAGCNHIDYVMTQLPYALLVAIFTGIGYIVLGLTDSVFLGILTIAVELLVLVLRK